MFVWNCTYRPKANQQISKSLKYLDLLKMPGTSKNYQQAPKKQIIEILSWDDVGYDLNIR